MGNKRRLKSREGKCVAWTNVNMWGRGLYKRKSTLTYWLNVFQINVWPRGFFCISLFLLDKKPNVAVERERKNGSFFFQIVISSSFPLAVCPGNEWGRSRLYQRHSYFWYSFRAFLCWSVCWLVVSLQLPRLFSPSPEEGNEKSFWQKSPVKYPSIILGRLALRLWRRGSLTQEPYLWIHGRGEEEEGAYHSLCVCAMHVTYSCSQPFT